MSAIRHTQQLTPLRSVRSSEKRCIRGADGGP